jgi:RNA polymerase sigma factor (sigma-70 family)
LTRRAGDFDAADDAVQDALIAAAEHWPVEGIPPNPRAWLLTTAGRRLIDQRRSERARTNRELEARVLEPDAAAVVVDDDTLALFFMCVHPALTPASSIALTLRAVGGLTTAEIAKAFLVPEATMAQRISRAKRTIKESGVAFRRPTAEEEAATVGSVLHVLYLIFNEGYASSGGGQLQRVDLSSEAIRLGVLVHAQLPDVPEATGLLALMLLIDARRPARVDARGDLIPLADQDRGLWDHGQIAQGMALLDTAIGVGRVGEYQVQAAIAAIHDRAPSAADTDWPQILALYGLLERMTGNPVVTLNRAVAAAMADGPAAGLAILDGMDGVLVGSHRFKAVRAHLLEMAGDSDGAIADFQAAARMTTNLPEQRYLTTRAARLREHRA